LDARNAYKQSRSHRKHCRRCKIRWPLRSRPRCERTLELRVQTLETTVVQLKKQLLRKTSPPPTQDAQPCLPTPQTQSKLVFDRVQDPPNINTDINTLLDSVQEHTCALVRGSGVTADDVLAMAPTVYGTAFEVLTKMDRRDCLSLRQLSPSVREIITGSRQADQGDNTDLVKLRYAGPQIGRRPIKYARVSERIQLKAMANPLSVSAVANIVHAFETSTDGGSNWSTYLNCFRILSQSGFTHEAQTKKWYACGRPVFLEAAERKCLFVQRVLSAAHTYV